VLVKSDANDWSGRMQMGGQVRAITQRSDKRPLSLTFNVALATTETEILMSKLAEFRQLEKHLAEQLQALEALKEDAGRPHLRLGWQSHSGRNSESQIP
jgi:hypothetical protein